VDCELTKVFKSNETKDERTTWIVQRNEKKSYLTTNKTTKQFKTNLKNDNFLHERNFQNILITNIVFYRTTDFLAQLLL